MPLPPGPRIPSLLTVVHWMRRPFPFLKECIAKFGPIFTIRLTGMPPLVIFCDPTHVKEVFSNDGEGMVAGRFNQALRPFLGDYSLLMLDGKEHLRQRRLLLPAFHGERMHAYGQAMIDATHKEIDRWPLDKPFAVHKSMQAIALEVILQTVFGLKEGVLQRQMSKTIAEILEIASWPPLLFPFVQKDLGPYSPWGRFIRKIAESDRMLFQQIQERRGENTAARTDVLSLLIAARDEEGKPMTDKELRDELVTLLVAGHETTATALAWAFRWILATPEVQTRLRAELMNASQTGTWLPEQIAKLEYLDAVVRETLRLQPIVPVVGRILDRPMRVGGWDLPTNTGVVCSIFLAHRRPEVYPDPDRFDPNRFLGTKFTPYEFYPFGGGIRRCIGMAFAVYEMKMVLATIMRRATLRLLPNRPIRMVRRSITMAPSDGLQVTLAARQERQCGGSRTEFAS